MKFNARATFLVALLTPGVTDWDGNVTGPPPPPATITQPVPPPAPGGPTPAFHVAEVKLSSVVFETTSNGRVPIAGVVVANFEGSAATTDANGFYSFGPVWVCPCAAQPWVARDNVSVGDEGRVRGSPRNTWLGVWA